MNRLLFTLGYGSIFAFFAWSSTSQAQVRGENRGSQRVFKVSVEGVEHEIIVGDNGEEFVRPVLRGVRGYDEIAYEVGNPLLPVVRFYVDTEGTVDILADETSTEKLPPVKKRVFPAQPSVKKQFGVVLPFLINSAIYSLNRMLPAQNFSVKKLGTVRGKTRQLVTLYPLHYNPVTGEEKLIRNFEVQFTDDARAEIPEPNREGYAFVVGPRFARSPALREFIQFKQQLGYTPHILRVGHTVRTAAQIRNALRTLYTHNGLKYALLVGDLADVPAFETRRFAELAANERELKPITDHYYRCLDTENYEDDIGAPDIAVGRISVKTEEQLRNAFHRMMQYERGEFADASWIKKISYISSNDRNFWKVIEATFQYAIDKFTQPLAWQGTFPGERQVGGDKLFAITHKATGEDAVKRMNDGRGIITYGGHGAVNEWNNPHMSVDEVHGLSHPHAIPMVLAHACMTANFSGDSIAEAWLESNKGAALYWGSISYSMWDEDDILQRATYDKLFTENIGAVTEAFDHGLSQVWRHYGGEGESKYYWETYTVMGDPSLSLRTRAPHPIQIHGPQHVPGGTEEVRYWITDRFGRPQPNVRVSIANDDASHSIAARTDANGLVRVPLNDGIDYRVSATGSAVKAVFGRLHIEPGESDDSGMQQ